jgi:hypothetical protein
MTTNPALHDARRELWRALRGPLFLLALPIGLLLMQQLCALVGLYLQPAGAFSAIVLVLLQFGVALALAGLAFIVPMGLLFHKVTAFPDGLGAPRARLRIRGAQRVATRSVLGLFRPPRLQA